MRSSGLILLVLLAGACEPGLLVGGERQVDSGHQAVREEQVDGGQRADGEQQADGGQQGNDIGAASQDASLSDQLAPDGSPDHCAGKQCLTPPGSTCISSSTLRTYNKPGTCSAGTCTYPKTDVKCANGCSGGTCAAAPPVGCKDGKVNGTESDVDCGGSCPQCANGKSCGSSLDCLSGWCDAAKGDVCCQPGTTGCTKAALKVATTPWPYPVGNYYRYAPTAVVENGYRYTFWCANLNSGVVTDHIIMRRDKWTGTGWSVGNEKVALAPGAPGSWDDRHVCDPDVVRGEFHYKAPGESTAKTYIYALFYLGVDDEQWNGGVNQVGWAVSNDLQGPWKRVSVTKPLVSATQWWGAGQPAVTSIDGKGDVLLFYTRGDSNGTRTLRRKATLLNANAPVLASEKALPVDGLTELNGSPDPVNHGGALIYDIGRDLFWLIRAGHPFPSGCPDIISDHLQVASIPGPSVWSATGRWTVHANVTGALLGSARVFDGGFAKNAYGNLLFANRLDLVVSVSQACVGGNFATALWSYRSHGVTMSL